MEYAGPAAHHAAKGPDGARCRRAAAKVSGVARRILVIVPPAPHLPSVGSDSTGPRKSEHSMGKDHPTVLIAAAQGGDQQAKDQLVSAYLPLLYNVVGRALDGHADVDDVVQETVLRMLRGLPELRDPERFRSWLVAIAMNEIRTHWRERQSGAIPADRLDAAYDLPDPRADFVELTILELGLTGQRRQVAEATRWLDEDDRALLSLWWLETAGHLSRTEVAAALELSPQHTAVRVQRMKAQLEAARVVVGALAAEPPCVLLEDIAMRLGRRPLRPVAQAAGPPRPRMHGVLGAPLGARARRRAAGGSRTGPGGRGGGGGRSRTAHHGRAPPGARSRLARRRCGARGAQTGAGPAAPSQLGRRRRGRGSRVGHGRRGGAPLHRRRRPGRVDRHGRRSGPPLRTAHIGRTGVVPVSLGLRVRVAQRLPVAEPLAYAQGQAEEEHPATALAHHRRPGPEAGTARARAARTLGDRRTGHRTGQHGAGQGGLRSGDRERSAQHGRATALRRHGGQGLLLAHLAGRQGPRRPDHRHAAISGPPTARTSPRASGPRPT